MNLLTTILKYVAGALGTCGIVIRLAFGIDALINKMSDTKEEKK